MTRMFDMIHEEPLRNADFGEGHLPHVGFSKVLILLLPQTNSSMLVGARSPRSFTDRSAKLRLKLHHPPSFPPYPLP